MLDFTAKFVSCGLANPQIDKCLQNVLGNFRRRKKKNK